MSSRFPARKLDLLGSGREGFNGEVLLEGVLFVAVNLALDGFCGQSKCKVEGRNAEDAFHSVDEVCRCFVKQTAAVPHPVGKPPITRFSLLNTCDLANKK